MEHVLSEGYVGMVVVQVAHDGGHDVYLLHDVLAVVAAQGAVARSIEYDGHVVVAQRRSVVRVYVGAGVVGSNDEERVPVPRLLAGLAEELAQGMVAVGHALLQLALARGELATIALGQVEGGMRRGREDCRHKGLVHLAHAVGVELQELLVPDGPGAVEVVVAMIVGVFVVLRAPIVALEARGAGEGLEAHRAVLRTVEEGRLVALPLAQLAGQSAHVVERGRRQEERLHVVGQRREGAGHALDALAPVGIAVLPRHGSVGNEGVEEGREAAIGATAQSLVVETEVLLAEALQNEHHHVLGLEGHAVGRLVYGRIEGACLLVGEVVGHTHGFLAQRPIYRERCIEHDARLGRTVYILIGVGDGDGAHGMGEAASHASHAEGHGKGQHQHLREIVGEHQASGVELWTGSNEELPQQPRDNACQQHQIPVGQELLGHDFRHVACPLVAKLGKDRSGGALAGVGKIDAIHQVGIDGHRVAHHVNPSHHAIEPLLLFPVQREEQKQNDQRVGIENGRGVEKQARPKKTEHVAHRHRVGIEAPVGEHEHQSAQREQHVDHKQIAHQGHRRATEKIP